MPKKTSSKKGKSFKSNRASTGAPIFRAPRSESHQWGGDGTVICPDSVRVLLPYTEILLPVTAAGGLYWYVFRGNAVYDPDYTGTGAQPGGFDQWCFFYNSYVVLSSKITLELINAIGGLTIETAVAPLYTASAPASASDTSVARYAKSTIDTAIGNATESKITSSMSTAQMFGIPESAVVCDDLYSAAVTTNPAAAQTWYWAIAQQNIANATTLGSLIRVRLEYDVKFFDPMNISLSATRRLPQLKSSALSAETQSVGCSVTPGYAGAADAASPAPSTACTFCACQRANHATIPHGLCLCPPSGASRTLAEPSERSVGTMAPAARVTIGRPAQ